MVLVQDGDAGSVQAQEGVLRRRLVGSVLALALNNAPVNALSGALRRALWQALSQAAADPAVQALILTGDDRLFSAGADLAEFGQTSQSPSLPDLCTRIERFGKPVIVALRGHVLGGGLELALAAHYRIADVDARLGFPEIDLGLLPGAGGTQRLPRLVGAEPALRMMLSGKPVTAIEGLAMGLIDHVHESRLMPAALEFARKLPALRPTLGLRTGFGNADAYQKAVLKARKMPDKTPAQARIIECVEAALLLPPEQALAFERAAFDDLLVSPESVALRYLFRAEHRVGKVPSPAPAPDTPPLSRIGVWGAGEVSADLVSRALAAGLQVTFADPDRDALVTSLRRIADRAEDEVTAGRMTAEARDADWARLASMLSPVGLDGAELVAVRPGAPELTGGLAERPQVLLGALPVRAGAAVALSLGPGNLVELGLGTDSPAATIARADALVRRIGGRLVVTGEGGSIARILGDKLLEVQKFLRDQGMADPGVVQRICLAVLANEGARMVATQTVRCPEAIDVAAVAAGIVARDLGGPMHQADRRGLLVVRAELLRLADRSPGLFTPAPLVNDLIAQGKTLANLNS